MWVGVVLVAGSVVAGSAVVGSADDTTAVWAAARDLPEGQEVGADDLQPAGVRFVSAEDAAHYLPVSRTLPEDRALLHDVGAGDLLPAAALGAPDTADTVEVSVAVAPEHLPPSVGAGSRVDVWVIRAGRGAMRARVVLPDVAVLAAPSAGDSFAASGVRQVVLAVPSDARDELATLLAASGEGLVRVVGRR